jgi:hypothetical protein
MGRRDEGSTEPTDDYIVTSIRGDGARVLQGPPPPRYCSHMMPDAHATPTLAQ